MNLPDKIRVSDHHKEHGCCYDRQLVFDCEPGEGAYGSDVAMMAEVREVDQAVEMEKRWNSHDGLVTAMWVIWRLAEKQRHSEKWAAAYDAALGALKAAGEAK